MEPEIKTTKVLDLSDRFFIVIVILVAGVAMYYGVTGLYQYKNLPQNVPQCINVSGEGRVFLKPDIALVSLGVNTQGMKSQDVVNNNNQIMNAISKAVKDLGVEDKDIQTASYNLSPWYDYTEMGSVFRGYQLNQHVSVKIRNFDKISDILDAATSRGATSVGDLQFTVDDPIEADAEARAEAIKNAKQKAATLTNQTGLAIIKLVNISEGYAPMPQPMYGLGGATMEAKSIAPQIQTGQMEVTSTVTLTYLLK